MLLMYRQVQQLQDEKGQQELHVRKMTMELARLRDENSRLQRENARIRADAQVCAPCACLLCLCLPLFVGWPAYVFVSVPFRPLCGRMCWILIFETACLHHARAVVCTGGGEGEAAAPVTLK